MLWVTGSPPFFQGELGYSITALSVPCVEKRCDIIVVFSVSKLQFLLEKFDLFQLGRRVAAALRWYQETPGDVEWWFPLLGMENGMPQALHCSTRVCLTSKR